MKAVPNPYKGKYFFLTEEFNKSVLEPLFIIKTQSARFGNLWTSQFKCTLVSSISNTCMYLKEIQNYNSCYFGVIRYIHLVTKYFTCHNILRLKLFSRDKSIWKQQALNKYSQWFDIYIKSKRNVDIQFTIPEAFYSNHYNGVRSSLFP